MADASPSRTIPARSSAALAASTPIQPSKKTKVIVTEGQQVTSGGSIPTGKVTGPIPTPPPGKEVKLNALKALEQKYQDVKAAMNALLHEATVTLGSPPRLEESLLTRVDKAFDYRLDSWKVKIEEGISSNSEVIVLDPDLEFPRFKKKRTSTSRSEPPSSTAGKKQKITLSSSGGAQKSSVVQHSPIGQRSNTKAAKFNLGPAGKFGGLFGLNVGDLDADLDADLNSYLTGHLDDGDTRGDTANDRRNEEVRKAKQKQKELDRIGGCLINKGVAVSALDLCLRLDNKCNYFYTQGLGFCEVRSSRYNGHEFGSLVSSMIFRFLAWLPSAVTHVQTAPVDMTKVLCVELMAAFERKEFFQILKSAPALVQVAHPDPFWNKELVDFKKIIAASKEEPEVPVGSWTALLTMFARAEGDTSTLYTLHPSRKMLVRAAFERVCQLTRDSVRAVSLAITPTNPSRKTVETTLDGIREAELFLHRKIQGLGGSNLGKKGLKPSDEGMHFLLKRIYEMLLGLSLISETASVMAKEKEWGSAPGLTRAQVKALKTDLQSRSVFRSGPTGLPAPEWAVCRKEAYASLVTFITFGAAGWFSCFANHRKFNLADCYGVLTLGDQRLKALAHLSNDIESSHPLVSGSWKYLNGFLITLLSKAPIQDAASAEWIKNTTLWSNSLTTETIGKLVLADVFTEIAASGPSIASSGNNAVHPSLDVGIAKIKTYVSSLLKSSCPQLIKGSECTVKRLGSGGCGCDAELEEGGEEEHEEEEEEGEGEEDEDDVEMEEVDVEKIARSRLHKSYMDDEALDDEDEDEDDEDEDDDDD